MAPILDKLNDVCLRKVFQFLQLQDLCNAAEVCKQFKHISDEVFKSVHTNLDILKLIEGNKYSHDEWFMRRSLSEQFLKSSEQLLSNFGPFIETLHLTGHGESHGMDENELLTLVKTYCPSLNELTLHNIGNDDAFSIELLPLFGSLKKLSISAHDVCKSFIAILSDCHELKYLNAEGVPATMWMNHKFPKLETLVISNNWEFEYTEYESFLQSHGNLRTLIYDGLDIFPEFFAMISKGLPRLQIFCCYIREILNDDVEENIINENILQLSKIKSLRNLTFMCEASALKLLVNAFEKEKTPIEHFEILDCEIDSELIVGLSKLKSMKTLKLTRCEMAEETLTNLSKHLNRLGEIIIKDIKEFDLKKLKAKLAENICVVNSSKKLVPRGPDQCQGSADILNILNDDCIIRIFEFLPLRDLCNVADVCVRFQQNSQTVFQLHHACFKTDEITKGEDKDFMYTDVQQATEQLFRNFGSFIQELSLQGHSLRNGILEETILYLANKYCSSLSTLTLDRINVGGPMRWIMPFQNLFCQLPKLEIHSCLMGKDFGKFISCCRIHTIYISLLCGSAEWMSHTFSYLQSLMLIDFWNPALTEFIKMNRHLQSLMIYQSNLSSKIFKTVARYMPHLRGFCFAGRNIRDRRTRKNVLHLAKLKSLTNLTLNCELFSVKRLVDEFVKETIPISEFNISFATVDMELLEKLVNLKSLKSLQLRRVKMNKVSLIDLVKKLPELKELDIDIIGIDVKKIEKMLPFAENLSVLSIGSERSNVKIDIVSYQSILRIVKSRGTANKLCISIISEERIVFVPQYLLQENSYWLKIENEVIENLKLNMTDSDSAPEFEDIDSSSEESDYDSVMSVEAIDMEQ